MQFEKYWEEWEEITDDFAKLSARFQPNVIHQWEEMEPKPFIARDGHARSLLQVDSAQGKRN